MYLRYTNTLTLPRVDSREILRCFCDVSKSRELKRCHNFFLWRQSFLLTRAQLRILGYNLPRFNIDLYSRPHCVSTMNMHFNFNCFLGVVFPLDKNNVELCLWFGSRAHARHHRTFLMILKILRSSKSFGYFTRMELKHHQISSSTSHVSWRRRRVGFVFGCHLVFALKCSPRVQPFFT